MCILIEVYYINRTFSSFLIVILNLALNLACYKEKICRKFLFCLQKTFYCYAHTCYAYTNKHIHFTKSTYSCATENRSYQSFNFIANVIISIKFDIDYVIALVIKYESRSCEVRFVL